MRLRNVLLAHLCCVLVLWTTAGCLGPKARERVLVPALAGTVDRVTEDAPLADGYDADAHKLFADAVKDGRHAEALAMWPVIGTWCQQGIDRAQVGPDVKASLRNRVREFDLSLRKQVVRPLGR